MWNLLLIGIIAYLLGSLPSAYLVTRLFTGQDIRYAGNGNVGTRNTMQVAGRAAGLLTLALDAGKGAAAYWAARRWGQGTAAIHLAGAMVVSAIGCRCGSAAVAASARRPPRAFSAPCGRCPPWRGWQPSGWAVWQRPALTWPTAWAPPSFSPPPSGGATRCLAAPSSCSCW